VKYLSEYEIARIENAYREGMSINWTCHTLRHGFGVVKRLFWGFATMGIPRAPQRRKPYRSRQYHDYRVQPYTGPDWIGVAAPPYYR
jgi:hypothetical protein